MTVDQIIALIIQSGICAALVVFFVFQGQKREDRMATRIDNLESEIREEVLECLTSTRDVVKENTAVLVKLNQRLQ